MMMTAIAMLIWSWQCYDVGDNLDDADDYDDVDDDDCVDDYDDVDGQLATLSKNASNGISVLFPDHNHTPAMFLNLCADSTSKAALEDGVKYQFSKIWINPKTISPIVKREGEAGSTFHLSKEETRSIFDLFSAKSYKRRKINSINTISSKKRQNQMQLAFQRRWLAGPFFHDRIQFQRDSS